MKPNVMRPIAPCVSGEDIDPFYQDDNRIYLSCLNCQIGLCSQMLLA
jgi:hypothetical protein